MHCWLKQKSNRLSLWCILNENEKGKYVRFIVMCERFPNETFISEFVRVTYFSSVLWRFSMLFISIIRLCHGFTVFFLLNMNDLFKNLNQKPAIGILFFELDKITITSRLPSVLDTTIPTIVKWFVRRSHYMQTINNNGKKNKITFFLVRMK